LRVLLPEQPNRPLMFLALANDFSDTLNDHVPQLPPILRVQIHHQGDPWICSDVFDSPHIFRGRALGFFVKRTVNGLAVEGVADWYNVRASLLSSGG